MASLERAVESTWEAYDDALTKLINTVPTTAVGVAAVMAYVRDNDELNGVLGGDGERMFEFLGTIAKAACALARLPV